MSAGRGGLSFASSLFLPTRCLSRTPPFSLSISIAERNNALLQFDTSPMPPAIPGEATSAVTAWPEFHAGVAEGLRFFSMGILGRSWMLYHKTDIPSFGYGGLLFGLGLRGHLSSLSSLEMYRYLSVEHDASLMGLLLGICASKRGSMDDSLLQILRLHMLSSLLPALEFEIGHLSHLGAVIGLGLLFEGSCHISMSASLLEQVHIVSRGCSDGNMLQDSQLACRQLAAGISLGLICIGAGDRTSPGLSVRRLLLAPSITNYRSAKYPVSFTELRHFGLGDEKSDENSLLISIIMAASLMFLQTTDCLLADALWTPADPEETFYPIEQVPLRIAARSIILWNCEDPSVEWVWSQLPLRLQAPLESLIEDWKANPYTLQVEVVFV